MEKSAEKITIRRARSSSSRSGSRPKGMRLPVQRSRSASRTRGADSASTITVGLRLRPNNEDEAGECVLRIDGRTAVLRMEKTEKKYEFSQVFGMQASQEDVYNKLALPLVAQVVDGYNVCLFAYGQTGAGKTHSLSGTADDPGVIPRFIRDLLATVGERAGDQHLTASFYEIYQEKVYDLLNEGRTALRVRGGDNPYVEGLKERTFLSFEEFEELRRTAWLKRVTATTAMNRDSSRSHAVVHIKYSRTSEEVLEGEIREQLRSNLYFVDLAGSERVSKVGISRIEETASINSSLSILHGVIHSQQNNMRPCYRDSVLTRLLRECFGGNSRTAMIAAVSPAPSNRGETRSTLEFAAAAASVQQIPVKNVDPVAVAIKSLRMQNEELKRRLASQESMRDLLSFKLPVAPSIVELQPDPSLNSWEQVVGELSFSAFDHDASVAKFSVVESGLRLEATEDGVYLNGCAIDKASVVTICHGDRICICGQRIFLAFLKDGDSKLLRMTTYHLAKLEFMEKNFEKMRRELEKQAKEQIEAEGVVAMADLEQDASSLRELVSAHDSDSNLQYEKQAQDIATLQNCLGTHIKKAIDEVAIPTTVDRIAIFSLKQNVEKANFVLSHFDKDKFYKFSIAVLDETGNRIGAYFDDLKNKVRGEVAPLELQRVQEELFECHSKYTIPQEGSEEVGRLMFDFCRRLPDMTRVGGRRVSNAMRTALFNSTADAARRRHTSVKEFRKSIGYGRRSTFVRNYSAALGTVQENDDETIEKNFIRALASNYEAGAAGRVDGKYIVDELCAIIAELRNEVFSLRSIQRGAITKGVALMKILANTHATIRSLKSLVLTLDSLLEDADYRGCLCQLRRSFSSFEGSFGCWIRLLRDAEGDEFQDVGAECLKLLADWTSHMTVAVGCFAFHCSRYQPLRDSDVPKEIRHDFQKGVADAVKEVKNEAVDLNNRFEKVSGLYSDLALAATNALENACARYEERQEESAVNDVIIPLLNVIRELWESVSKVMTRNLRLRAALRRRRVFEAVARSNSLDSVGRAFVADALEVCNKEISELALPPVRRCTPKILADL